VLGSKGKKNAIFASTVRPLELESMNTEIATKSADNIRILSASMVEKAKSGHPGGAMGGADFIQILYSEFLTFDPDDRSWPFRDRFFLDPGHMSPMLYSALTLCGFIGIDDLRNFRQWGSSTPGHPEVDLLRGIENTSGPLGQGHTMAVGAAIAERFIVQKFGEWSAHKTYAYISDGGIQEEISQGAGRIAGYLGLSNLIMFFDSNDIQLSTKTSLVTIEDTAMKYQAWGWKVITIDGHDPNAIRKALAEALGETEKPVLIIGKTIMGKGCLAPDGTSFEGKTSTHGQPISKAGASFEKTVKNLGGDPENPFVIFKEVEAYYKEVLKVKREKAKERKSGESQWRGGNPLEASKLDSWLLGQMPKIDWKNMVSKTNVSTREASGFVLASLADTLENMIVMSADLANSDKTDGYLKKTVAMGWHDFKGKFLHAGVSELTMGAIANGMALHGGVIPVCGTFFVFSDYMKPAVRLAALMELQVIYVWTHDAFRVGEDGPTHQPVEQEAQIRLMEKLKNHSGKSSVLVLRPADTQETVVAWKMALESREAPTALLLSRQNVKDVPAYPSGSRFQQSLKSAKGAYVVAETGIDPKVVLVANGSEVSTLVEASQILLKKHKVTVRVVSVPSEGLFRQQSKGYQIQVLPDNLPVFGLTAGIPETLGNLVGKDGLVWGLDHFGYSAPAEVLDEKFGFTPENVVKQVRRLLASRLR
jgi:transketolase